MTEDNAAENIGKKGGKQAVASLLKMLEGINANKLKNKRNDKDEEARMKGINALLNYSIKKEQDVITVLTAYVQFYGLSICHDYDFHKLNSKFIKWFTKKEPKYLEKLFTEANSMGKSTNNTEYGVVTVEDEGVYFDIWGCSEENFPKIIQKFGEKSIDPLIDILGNKDYHYYLHQIAAEELGKFKAKSAKEVLTKAYESYSAHFPANSVRDAAKKALKKIKSEEGKGQTITVSKFGKYLSKKDVDLDDVQTILENMGPLSKSDLSDIEKYLHSTYDSAPSVHFTDRPAEKQISEIWNLARRILIENGYNEMEILRKNIEDIDNSGYPSLQCIESTKRLGEIKSKESLDLIVKLVEKVKTRKLVPIQSKYGLSSLNNLKKLGTGKTKTKIVGLMTYLLTKACLPVYLPKGVSHHGSAYHAENSFLGTRNSDLNDIIIGDIADICNHYKSEKSAEVLIKALTLEYLEGSGFAMYGDKELDSGQKIVKALRNIGKTESKDSLIVCIKQLRIETGTNNYGGLGYNVDIYRFIFATLLSLTDDVKRLDFFVKHWKRKQRATKEKMGTETKKLYDIAWKDNSKDNIAHLIKELVGNNHSLYKSYFSNIGGKDDPRKFLLSDDPGMQLMGISLAKGMKYPEDIQPILMSLALFSNEENIRKEALECVKDIGIEKIAMPTEKDWDYEMSTNYFPWGNNEKRDPGPLIESLLSLESTKSLPHLKHIYNRATYKHGKLIVDGVAKFCDRKECVKFYDELIKTSIIGDYSWNYGYSIEKLHGKSLFLLPSAYVEINAQERHGIIFSKTFDELVFAITHKATTEEEQGPLRGFIKKGMGLCFKLDKNSPSNGDRTLLLLKKHLFSNRGPNSREKKIAAAQIFEILYKSRKSRKRISEIVEPARKDRFTLVRTSLKSIK